ncbi:MAG: hypothetical protein FWG14_04135 [Peptococcaceae bacterium]|nr:hypothetical protein [Peptococcaceae bacterium]
MSDNASPNTNSNVNAIANPYNVGQTNDLGTTGGLYITLLNVPVGAFQLKVLILLGPAEPEK